MKLTDIALRAALLGGLMMTGIVDGSAQADQTQADPQLGPASVKLVIETLDGTLHQNIYFAPGSANLSEPASLLLIEIAADLENFDLADISLYDGLESLDLARARVVADHLEQAGLPANWVHLELGSRPFNLL